MNIQWYPGHMTKTRRMIAEQIKHVDAVCEIVDARIPVSSRNPDVDELTAGKPRLVVLNRVVRVMILGVPNVGKSTFINRIAGRKTAKTEDRPGVTRAKQWVPIDRGLELLDTPGILWPKFEDQSVGLNLAYTGAVKDEILDMETLGCHLMAYLGTNYPEALRTGYKLPSLPERQDGEEDVAWGYRLLEAAGKKRGFLISGGEVDTERMAKILLDEYRAGKLGRFTLEMPEETEQPAASE